MQINLVHNNVHLTTYASTYYSIVTSELDTSLFQKYLQNSVEV